jgi:hypothetical protein
MIGGLGDEYGTGQADTFRIWFGFQDHENYERDRFTPLGLK